jgi:tetratricopeptide (TPR) repeat protein
MNINNYELAIYAILILTNCVIAYHWAICGLFEAPLDPKRKKPLIMALIIGMGTLIIAGYMQRYGIVKLELLTEKNIVLAAICLLGPALVLMVFVRLLSLRTGIPEYNRARAVTQFWTIRNFKPGRILYEEGGALREFPRAKRALEYFNIAIATQKKGTAVSSVRTEFPIDGKEPDYNGLYSGRCPVCGFELKFPDSTTGVTGHCVICRSMVAAKRIENVIYVSVFGELARRTVLSVRNKINIATALGEKALLLRMMNCFDAAKTAATEALQFVDSILAEKPEDREILTLQSLIIFRIAEIEHVSGDKATAERLYQQCLAIDESIGYTGDKDLINGLIGRL